MRSTSQRIVVNLRNSGDTLEPRARQMRRLTFHKKIFPETKVSAEQKVPRTRLPFFGRTVIHNPNLRTCENKEIKL